VAEAAKLSRWSAQRAREGDDWHVVDRRDPANHDIHEVPCRACGAPLLVDPLALRVSASRVEVLCPSCRTWITVRRSDAMLTAEPTELTAETPRRGSLRRKVKQR
jgi:hypothetical protein